MFIAVLNVLFVLLCLFLVLIILLQKSKGSLGMVGTFGNPSVLFGGSGGQDLFQKITWWCVAFFMCGSLILAVLYNRSVYKSHYIDRALTFSQQQAQSAPINKAPIPTESANAEPEQVVAEQKSTS